MTTAGTEPLDLAGLLPDPYPAYARLRADGGVHRSERWDAWFVTTYEQCHAVFSDAARFDAVGQPFLRMLQAEVLRGGTSWRTPQAPPAGDDPARAAGRRTTGRALGTPFVDSLWPRFERDCRETAAALPATADLVADFAIPLTTRLLADLMAVTPADLPVFAAWAESGYTGGPSRTAVRDVRHLLAQQAVSRVAEPVDDFVGNLVAHPGADLRAHLELVLGTGLMISMVTHQGLVLSFSTLLNALMAAPDQYALLRADPGLIPNAVEEGLRFDSSTQALGRLSRVDAELGGTRVPAGRLLVCLTGSANRDGAQFPDPDRFDVTRPVRSSGRHLSFGHGATSCLGAAMSRRALGHMLSAIVARADRVLPSAEPRLFEEFMTRGFVSLPTEMR
ncbi:cytochrome P450 [Actinokineospora sp. UTMC 2448]|uniref:cytochrome P450 n=1 Tax=Actinokineospora sp. UTMC 2448 TaxID=2268449 RepID=UPI00216495B9|nr:cytochrome P450 [Actinokineospora sp. UTMC 2448]UVS78678.1 Cytochrome P450 PerU [Actinokineospora sp. UTMC 2448]